MKNDSLKGQHRVNEQIRAKEVRIVGDDIESQVYPLAQALKIAEEHDADLVEISPNAQPPVCRIIDYSKFLYQLKKRQKEQKAKQVKVNVKEIRFGPQTDDHDYNFKLKHAKGFLEDGDKVKAYVFFKGRSILFKEQGEVLLLRFANDLEDFAKVDLRVAEIIDYPLHLGVTEAGTLKSGLIKSSIGLGTLLSQGIGDTIRVSLTENPVEEVEAGFGILKALNLRQRGVNFVSCPTCGRTQIDLIGLAKKVEERFKNLDLPITIAVMGCPVNGPGEAKHADFGIAGAIKEGYIFKKGEIIARVPESDLINSLEKIIMESYRLED